MLLAGSILILFQDRPAEASYILVPILAAAWICSVCIATVWRKDREVPVLDIGVVCVVFTTLYIIIPLTNYYFGGLEFGPLSDGRLQHHRPSPQELGLFFGNHIAYLASLAFAYSFFRHTNHSLPRVGVSPPRALTLQVLVAVFLILSVYFAVLLYVFGIGFKSAYLDESLITEGPLWLAQINGKLAEIYFVFQSALLGFLVLQKGDLRVRWFLFVLIAWNTLSAFLQPGSRGELMSLLLLTFLFWHKFHGTAWRFTLVFLPVAFAAFMFLGQFRSFLNLSELIGAMEAFETLASASNEFQSLLGTALDVQKMIENAIEIPPVLAYNDLTPMLPPQQFLSFPKLSGADWYLIQTGIDGTGVGYMWGVVSQSLVGYGLFELIARGAVLGWFLACVHHWYQRRYTRFLPTVVYVILCLNSLWTFRDTTGAILWMIWWGLIPFALVIYVLGLRSEFSPDSANGVGSDRPSPAPLPRSAGSRWLRNDRVARSPEPSRIGSPATGRWLSRVPARGLPLADAAVLRPASPRDRTPAVPWRRRP